MVAPHDGGRHLKDKQFYVGPATFLCMAEKGAADRPSFVQCRKYAIEGLSTGLDG